MPSHSTSRAIYLKTILLQQQIGLHDGMINTPAAISHHNCCQSALSANSVTNIRHDFVWNPSGIRRTSQNDQIFLPKAKSILSLVRQCKIISMNLINIRHSRCAFGHCHRYLLRLSRRTEINRPNMFYHLSPLLVLFFKMIQIMKQKSLCQ